MVSYRLQRIAEQIQEEISGLIVKGLKDPRIGFVTITGVEVSPDLRQAKVFFCSPGNEDEREQSRTGLQSASGFIRKSLLKRLSIRIIPELEFLYDKSLDQGDRIERLLVEVRKKEGWDDPNRIQGSAAEVAKALTERRRFLVTSHTNPDGDAIASMLAIRRLLSNLGKEVCCYHPDVIPVNYRFLPDIAQIKTVFEADPYDATIVLDCSELSRVGPLPDEEKRGMLIGIDHHLITKPLGQVHYLNPTASSIGEMIDSILLELKMPLDVELATCVYTSILSDTGSFRYANTTPAALNAASRMLAAGVSPWEVARQVYETQPLRRYQLLAKVLATLEVDVTGRYGSILISQQMFRETNASEDLVDGFINYPRGVDGVEVAIQFRELEDGQYKVSFRSRGNVNVAAISERFGGGGHFNAAGCTLAGSLPEVRAQVFEAVESSLKQ